MTASVDAGSKKTLDYWANHDIGSARLSKRAWAVLENLERRGGLPLAQATGGSAQLNKWIKDFLTMGLVGLVDAPRGGRPRKQNPDRSVHAKWRDARLTGGDFERTHRMSLPLCSSEPLAALASLFVCQNLVVFAFCQEGLLQNEKLLGEWVDVPRRLSSQSNRSVWPHLTTALKFAKTHQQHPQRAVEEQQIRFCGRLHELCQNHPRNVDVVIAAAPDGRELRTILSEFRKLSLWVSNDRSPKGLLRSLAIHGMNGSGHEELTQFLAPYLGGNRDAVHKPPALRLNELCRALDRFGSAIFEWHRLLPGHPNWEDALRLGATSTDKHVEEANNFDVELDEL